MLNADAISTMIHFYMGLKSSEVVRCYVMHSKGASTVELDDRKIQILLKNHVFFSSAFSTKILHKIS